MRYFDINVSYGDSDGYSIFIAVNGNEDAALEKAIKENRFEYDEDVNNIEYIDEITEEEYNEWKQNRNFKTKNRKDEKKL